MTAYGVTGLFLSFGGSVGGGGEGGKEVGSAGGAGGAGGVGGAAQKWTVASVRCGRAFRRRR